MADDTTYKKDSISTTLPSTDVSKKIETVFKSTSIGSIDSAIGNSIYGINHRQTPGVVPINRDFYGLAFFTKPELNMTKGNLRMLRKFIPLLTGDANSIQRIIRCSLDPRIFSAPEYITTPFVDTQQAFIPMLTNNLISMSGWPDMIAPTMTSQEGLYKEAWSMVDGITDIYSTYDIQANFRNIDGDPISALFAAWVMYASAVYVGDMVPYPIKIIQNEIDYQTRIYRLILDSNKMYVRKIAACGASFPLSVPMGSYFNFESDRPVNNSNDQISIPFRCIGAIYNDDILIDEFNKVVGMHNYGMRESDFSTSKNSDGSTITANRSHTKITMDKLALFNNRGYPRINPNTYELEWWVPNNDYANVMSIAS